jgi:hypothetical protein
VAQRGIDRAVRGKRVDDAGEEGRETKGGDGYCVLRITFLILCLTRYAIRTTQYVTRQQIRAEAAEDRRQEQGDIARQWDVGRQEQRQRDDGVEEVEGVEDQVDAQRIPDQLRVERAGAQIEQSVLEIPDVPAES